jgi:hypothetical protein
VRDIQSVKPLGINAKKKKKKKTLPEEEKMRIF